MKSMSSVKGIFSGRMVLFTAILVFSLLMLNFTAINAADMTATVNPNSVICPNFIGNGVQWDAYTDLSISDAQLTTVKNRVAFANVKFIRCCMMATWYWTGSYDGNGNPNNYNWNSSQMTSLYKVLDYCQSSGITVMLGEWDPPGREWANHVWADNPAWPKMVADCLNYLHNTKGYTCIKYYNLGNEPNGDWMHFGYNYVNGQDVNTNTDAKRYANWKIATENLYSQLSSRGYLSWIKMTEPDNSGNDEWVGRAAMDENSKIGMYDFHRYASKSETEGGTYETSTVIGNKNQILTWDPNGASKPMMVSELGMIEGKVNPDSQPNVQNFIYGVWYADLVAQSLRGGAYGTCAWMLDDAMHTGGGYGSLNLKEWGLWNTFGGANGYPASDANLRPWYYTWSLMSKFFPQGCQTLQTNYSTSISGLRVTAMKKANGSNWDVTFLVVNDSDTARSVLLKLTGGGNCTMKQYNYLNSDRPVDGNGYPVVKMDRVNTLDSGLQVDFSGRGVIIVTTMGGGTPVSIGGGSTPAASPTPTKTPTTTPGSGNLALNKPAYASSYEAAGYEPAKAFDGNTGSRWSSVYSDNQSLWVDLGSNQTVAHVKLRWEAAYAKSYQIQTSTDGANWTTVADDWAGAGGTVDKYFTATTVRYVKIYCISRATVYGFSLWEFEVYRN